MGDCPIPTDGPVVTAASVVINGDLSPPVTAFGTNEMESIILQVGLLTPESVTILDGAPYVITFDLEGPDGPACIVLTGQLIGAQP